MRISTFLLLLFFCLQSKAQNTVDFKELFLTENGKQLADRFSKSIDLDLPQAKATFDKKQASIVISKFFDSFPPAQYKSNHKGGGNGRANYEIGLLTSGKNEFRTYLLYYVRKETIEIIELRIELEE